MKIAVIGAGAAGLASLKHCLDEGHTCTVFEQTGNIGGTWNYVEKVGVDEFGLPIHSSMYEELRTNLPKELMQFEDFSYKKTDISFVLQEEVLTYINDYAKFFNLLPHIKFFNHVLHINPLPEGKWITRVKNLNTSSIEEGIYDAIIVCVGHYSVPNVADIQGIDKFEGNIIHSHNYRKSDLYKNKKVLVVGAGPSGIDIGNIVSKVADKVFISIRSDNQPVFNFQPNVSIRPEIQKINETNVTFKDNTEENIDHIILCTGYLHTYPFLSPMCSIEIENNWVKYLYKQIVNVDHPTMGFIGVPFRGCPFPLFSIQVRFFLAFLKGNIQVSKEQMMQELKDNVSKNNEEGNPPHFIHMLGLRQGWYMDDLAEVGNIAKVPPVIQTLFEYVLTAGRERYDISYKIVNDNEYIVLDS